MLAYVQHFLEASIFSIIVETAVVVLLCIITKKDVRISLVAGLGTLCTIPYVWFVFPTIFWYSSILIVLVGEIFAFLFETVLYKFIGKLTWANALLFSLIANLVSFIFWRMLF